MKPKARGTRRDPRALKHEQWIVKVRMLDHGRTVQVPADQAKWEKLRENDRVKVRYRTGKYTGTVLGPLRLSENSAHAKLPLLAA